MDETQDADPKRLRPGPIRNESPSPDSLEQINAVFVVIGPYFNMTLQQFEIGFKGGRHSQSEVAL